MSEYTGKKIRLVQVDLFDWQIQKYYGWILGWHKSDGFYNGDRALKYYKTIIEREHQALELELPRVISEIQLPGRSK